MALDGVAVANIVSELNKKLLGGRLDKVYQPLHDEIAFTVRSIGSNFRVLASANSSHPRIHLTKIVKDNPMAPPLFCMVLRKHIAGGKILSITQPNFERIIIIEIESMNDMGDMTSKKLILEIMGKHSNLILTDENDRILDAIKRVSHDKSSVREVLPGKDYVLPPSQNKKDPTLLNKEEFLFLFKQQDERKIQELLFQSYTGISPIMASEICHRSGVTPETHCTQLDQAKQETLFSAFSALMEQVKNKDFSPEMITDEKSGKPVDFAPISLTMLDHFSKESFVDISSLLEHFYSKKDNLYHVQQKSHDMRRVIQSNVERCVKKREIQDKTENDTAAKGTWKTKGELITANIYAVKKGDATLRTVNFYDPEMAEIEIALDTNKTPAENAARYFNKYNKAKRTLVALELQRKQNDEELSYLESILVALENASDESDINEIREELAISGYMKRKFIKKGSQQKLKKAKPMHFISSDGLDIYVGKNNIQNDELTLRFAEPTDIWFHTQKIPGSHVILCTNGSGTAPNQSMNEAVNLAAFYSKAKNGSLVPVDYVERKRVKKPSGAKPGFVIYDRYQTAYITPEEKMVLSLNTDFLQ